MPDDLVALRVDNKDHVATVTLLRTIMDKDFWREVPLVFEEFSADPDVRVVVLTGGDEIFSEGLDWAVMAPVCMSGAEVASSRTELMMFIRGCQAAMSAVANCRKPVVAAVSGWCLGVALDLLAATDIRLAASNAKFSLFGVKTGVVQDFGVLQRLVTIIGEGYVRELAFTGATVDAYRAMRMGLINNVYGNPGDVLHEAHRMAAEIADNAPLAVQGVKDVLNFNRDGRIVDGLRYVATWNAAYLPNDDLYEAVRARSENRPPKFHGR